MIESIPNPFPWACVAGIVLQIIIRAPYQRQARDNPGILSHYDLGERLLIFLVFVGMVIAPIAHLAVPALRRFDWLAPAHLSAIVGSFGLLVLAFGLWLFWRAHADLGANWSPSLEIRQHHSLVSHGVYRRIRHPMYAAIWLFGLAQILLLQNWLTGPAAVVLFCPLYFLRVPREEQMLRVQFGDAWDAFAAARGRVVPRVLPRRR